MRYIVCYDITDNRVRYRLVKLLESLGRRLEKSVFECIMHPRDMIVLHDRIMNIIEVADGDCCHMFHVCQNCEDYSYVIGNDYEQGFGELMVV